MSRLGLLASPLSIFEYVLFSDVYVLPADRILILSQLVLRSRAPHQPQLLQVAIAGGFPVPVAASERSILVPMMRDPCFSPLQRRVVELRVQVDGLILSGPGQLLPLLPTRLEELVDGRRFHVIGCLSLPRFQLGCLGRGEVWSRRLVVRWSGRIVVIEIRRLVVGVGSGRFEGLVEGSRGQGPVRWWIGLEVLLVGRSQRLLVKRRLEVLLPRDVVDKL